VFKLKCMLVVLLLLFTGVKAHDKSSVKQKYSQVLNPSVQINFRDAIGTGVVVKREESTIDKKKIYKYTVITVHHIFINRGDVSLWGENKTCFITFYKNSVEKTYLGSVIKESADLDLCLIEFITEDKINDIATLANKDVLSRIKVFDQVYLVGCQAGLPPMVTYGLISLLLKQKDAFVTDAEAYLGSSGGGMFKYDKGKYYLIGICKSIWTHGGDHLSHISFSSSAKSVLEFMEK